MTGISVELATATLIGPPSPELLPIYAVYELIVCIKLSHEFPSIEPSKVITTPAKPGGIEQTASIPTVTLGSFETRIAAPGPDVVAPLSVIFDMFNNYQIL
jgi:hypothetical protein